ncbi:MAG: peptide chain release factor N(5)-glutamine methyltransferase [Gallionella sp.]
MKLSIQEILRNDSLRIEAALGLEPATARIEVQMLLQYVLGVVRSHLLAYPEQKLDEKQSANYQALLARRLSGEPVAYITGMREFYGLEFKVTPAALIPRPETELLVEQALQHFPSPSATLLPLPQAGEGPGPGRRRRAFRILDLGTGSGAIALSIAHARPDIEVVAVDASQGALAVARENSQMMNIGNVHFLLSDWFAGLQGEHFDLIVSNAPYIASDDTHLTQGDLRFEPHSALASGADGLDDIRHIIGQAKLHLNPKGHLLLEHSYDQAAQVRSLLQLGGFAEVNSWCDLSGIERVSGGVMK